MAYGFFRLAVFHGATNAGTTMVDSGEAHTVGIPAGGPAPHYCCRSRAQLSSGRTSGRAHTPPAQTQPQRSLTLCVDPGNTRVSRYM
eukprot:COSAG01_NODE_2145_length_8304_cov_162.380256_8_plen_87_part_00